MSDAMNPFDPANLGLSQNFIKTVGVKTLLTAIPVRKPNRQDFVWVHPDSDQSCRDFATTAAPSLMPPEPIVPDEIIGLSRARHLPKLVRQ
jgi:hypothetical protein